MGSAVVSLTSGFGTMLNNEQKAQVCDASKVQSRYQCQVQKTIPISIVSLYKIAAGFLKVSQAYRSLNAILRQFY